MIEHDRAEPVRLILDAQNGALLGSNGRYEKHLNDLVGVYRNREAFDDAIKRDSGSPVYWVEDLKLPGSGELITGISVLEPGLIGDEYYMTRGHLHARADRAELYLCLSGTGVMLLETLAGDSRAIELKEGQAVQVPGHWVHRSVNVGSDRFVTLFSYPADSGQNYDIIAEAGGMKNLVVTTEDGWTTRSNPDHKGYNNAE